MAEFPSTTEELEQLISDYMTAHLAEQMEDVTSEQIAQAVNAYMQSYGAAVENNGEYGDVPLVNDNALDVNNTAIPLALLSNGVPTSYIQAKVSAIAQAAAGLITHADIPMGVVVQSQTSVAIAPNVLNVWTSAVESLTIAFNAVYINKVNEFMMQFTVDGDEFGLTLPVGVRWAEEPEWEDGYTYQVSIVNNLAVYAGWEAQS